MGRCCRAKLDPSSSIIPTTRCIFLHIYIGGTLPSAARHGPVNDTLHFHVVSRDLFFLFVLHFSLVIVCLPACHCLLLPPPLAGRSILNPLSRFAVSGPLRRVKRYLHSHGSRSFTLITCPLEAISLHSLCVSIVERCHSLLRPGLALTTPKVS